MITVKPEAIWVGLDNEGPETKDDNAQKATVALAKKCGLGEKIGKSFYERISVIDDMWGDYCQIPQDPSYSSGHALKVILPFYKAMGATSQWLYDFAIQSLLVVPNIRETLAYLNKKYNVWQISTGFEWFIRSFCDKFGFDFDQTYCTRVPISDEIPITSQESAMLLDFMVEVARMPVIEYDKKTGEVIPGHQIFYNRITSFIWDVVYNLPVGEFLRIIHPVGQTQKREALEEICLKFGVPKERVMYVGDSQTDVQVVEWLRGAGLTMMFNGKGRVCGLSDLMYVGEDARAIKEVADLFAKEGRQGVIDYYAPRQPIIYRGLLESLGREAPGGFISSVCPENIATLEAMSIQKRKKFRGVAIGELT